MAKVKVRVAVAVDPSGDYCCQGWPHGDPADMMSEAASLVADSSARYWLEAELDIPEPVTVQAEVTRA